jgi:predicted glycoside hydrolase/deacetylase ChbG (UPF0249 family)
MSAIEGRAASARYLIVNADDFGLTDGINRGIIEASEKGIVRSASLMVRQEHAPAAAFYAREHPHLSVGLHFDVAEWLCREGNWETVYEVIDRHDPEQVRHEFGRQLEKFDRLTGRMPTHLDSHQHIHDSEPARAILRECSAQLRIPLRRNSAIHYRGEFYGQTAEGRSFPKGISLDRLVHLIESLAPGWSEIGCHPGYSDGLASIYASEREDELRLLCGAEVRAALDRCGVELASFSDYALSTRFAAGPEASHVIREEQN